MSLICIAQFYVCTFLCYIHGVLVGQNLYPFWRGVLSRELLTEGPLYSIILYRDSLPFSQYKKNNQIRKKAPGVQEVLTY